MFIQFRQAILAFICCVSFASDSHGDLEAPLALQAQENLDQAQGQQLERVQSCTLATRGHSLLQANSIVNGGSNSKQRVPVNEPPEVQAALRNVTLLHVPQRPVVNLRLSDILGGYGHMKNWQMVLVVFAMCGFLFCLACFCISALSPEQEEHQGSEDPGHMMECSNCHYVFGIPPGYAHVKCPTCGMLNKVETSGGREVSAPTIPTNVYNQSIGLYSAPVVSASAPQATGTKKALLVGINYFGTQAELRGCINDVRRMRHTLSSMYGFPTHADAMKVLVDDGQGHAMPTRQNILAGLQWLVHGAQPGDALFFHFSGHGAQQEDPDYAEEDGYDETICPCDFTSAGMIVDDEMFDIMVAPLPSGAKLTAVMDCCHSGTGLDLPFILKGPQFVEEDNPCHSMGDVLMISGCQDEQCSSDGGGAYGRPQGAMTTALCNVLEKNRQLNVLALQEQLRYELKTGGFDQVPSITSSQQFQASHRLFSMAEGFVPNRNAQLGRQFTKKKHPKNPHVLQGGLGEILMAGALGFMMDDMLVNGLMMGGAVMLSGGMETGALVASGAAAASAAADTGGDMFGGFMSALGLFGSDEADQY